MKQKKDNKRKARSKILILCILLMATLNACGSKETAEKVDDGGSVTNSDSAAMTDIYSGEYSGAIKAFKEQYLNHGENEYKVSQDGNYKVGNVELSDPVVISEEDNSEWLGYSEVELGFLTPEEMPNCIIAEESSGANTMAAILYNDVPYFYVNDMIKELERAIGEYGAQDSMGQLLNEYKKYSNVWVTSAIDVEDIKVLGGLEEYGKYCAQRGDN